MLVLIVLGVALVSSLLTGGRLRYIENFHLKALPLGVGAFVIQLLIFTSRGESLLGALLPGGYVLTLLMLLAFLLLNRRVFGVPILLVGLMLNVLVIGANHGRMPADPQALVATGQGSHAEELVRDGTAANVVLMSDRTHLNLLGDYIVLPFLGDMGSAYSAGDLVALVGEVALVFGMVRAGRTAHAGSNEDQLPGTGS
jgi:membrane protein required for beta-lactamase induction